MLKSSREERKERRRNEILWAAFRVFAERGYHNTKIADIAKVLKMGHGTFYRYFQNKLDIFSHVIDSVIERITAMIGLEDPQSTSTLEEYRAQVYRIGQRLFDVLLTDQKVAQLLFEEAPGIDPQLSKKIDEAWALFGRYTEMYLQNGKDKGFLRPQLNTYVTALGINAMIFEGGRQAMRADDANAIKDEWLDAIISLIFEGIAQRHEAPS